MAKLTAKRRKSMPASKFALSNARKYPVGDKSHAANAKARAEQQYKKGNLSKAKRNKVDRKANKKLYGSKKAPKGRKQH